MLFTIFISAIWLVCACMYVSLVVGDVRAFMTKRHQEKNCLWMTCKKHGIQTMPFAEIDKLGKVRCPICHKIPIKMWTKKSSKNS